MATSRAPFRSRSAVYFPPSQKPGGSSPSAPGFAAALVLFLALAPLPAAASDGVIDPDFGFSGAIVLGWNQGGALSDWIRDVAAEDGDRLFAVGNFDSPAGDDDWGIGRLRSDGWVETSQYLVFNLGGLNSDVPTGAELDRAGGLLIAGYAESATSSEVRLCRLRTSDLGLDLGFANGAGCAAFSYLSVPLYAVALARAGDGGWLVGGQLSWGGGDSDFFVAKFTASGLLDATFNALDPFHPGLAVVPVDLVAQGADALRAIAVDHLGRILLAGDAQSPTAGNAAVVARLTASGLLDSTFGSSGIQTWAFFDGLAEHPTWAMSVAVDPVLDSFVVGYSHQTQVASEVAAEVGHFDASGNWQVFPGSGTAVRDVTWQAGGGNWLENVLYQSDGRILATGDSSSGQVYQVTRLLPDGTVDSTWGAAGVASFSPSGQGWGSGHGVAGATLSGGRLVVFGTVSGPDDNWLLARFTNALIFRDGFETGDRAHWSGGQP